LITLGYDGNLRVPQRNATLVAQGDFFDRLFIEAEKKIRES